MKKMLLFPVGSSAACAEAARFLQQAGIPVTDHPMPEVTHLLLDVPGFRPDGILRNGDDIRPLLRMLPPEITVIGGRLQQPALENYQAVDLLLDEEYLARNAAITAECALQVAAAQMPVVFSHCPVLVLGWGRIGKCLGALLKNLGAEVTIAARREQDRGMIRALGYRAAGIREIQEILPGQRLVFNTVPQLLLTEKDTAQKPCLFVDLASEPGMAGNGVIRALGLPGKYAPESSGRLIAHRILKQIREGIL